MDEIKIMEVVKIIGNWIDVFAKIFIGFAVMIFYEINFSNLIQTFFIQILLLMWIITQISKFVFSEILVKSKDELKTK